MNKLIQQRLYNIICSKKYKLDLNIFSIQLTKRYLLFFISFLIITLTQPILAQRMGLETKLLPKNLESITEFGKSVAISGNVAIVGAQGVTNGSATYSGAAFMYEFDGNEWIQTQKLIASDVGVTGDEFGVDVDIEGNVAVVGATFNEYSGSVYIFNYDGVRWVEVQKLKGQRPSIQEGFGVSLGLRGKTLIVGTSAFSAPGYAYIFELDGIEWIQKQVLIPSNSSNEDFFGRSVACYEDKAVIGTSLGRAYVFHSDGINWTEKSGLEPADVGGQNNLRFGREVSIYSNSILIGRDWDNINETESGSAYVFEYDGNNWYESQKLLADDGEANDRFGNSLHLVDDLLIIGSPNNRSNRGAAYIFEYDGAGWVQKYKLIKGDDEANDPEAQSHFGNSVAITNNVALVGAWGTEEDGQKTGASYLYEFMAQPGNVTAADGESNNQVRISWNNRSNNADGFRIYRDGVEIGSTVLAATSFNDIDAIPGKLYNYEVTAYNNYWEESPFSFIDIGWRRANGNIKGTIQTERGAGIKDVDLTATPVDSTLGLSLNFDGVNDYVTIPPLPRYDEMTISAWIKTSSANSQQILSWGNTENGHSIEFKTMNGELVYLEKDSQPGALVTTNNERLDRNKWTNVTVVVNNDQAQLFINGQAQPMVSGVKRMTEVNTFTIGALQVGPDFLQPFDGGIDDIQLWNRVLTEDEINNNMLYSLDGNEEGLSAYWSFNDSTRSTGKIAGDYAQKGNNHGKIFGAEWSNDTSPVAYRDLTDADGEFYIGNLFYDDAREFRVTPFKIDHLFDPEDKDVLLESGGGPNVSFNDTTVFTLSGQISFANNSCPVEGVELLVDGDNTGIFTDSDGNFELAIEEPGKTYTITPQFGDSSYSHSFAPAEISLFVDDDIDEILFEDTQQHLFYGKVRGGCIVGLGVAHLQITSLQNPECLDTIITTDINGNYRLFFPAQEYLVDLIYIDNPDSSNILNYFAADTVDITWENQRQLFVYHPKPQIRLEILPHELTCDNVPLMQQYSRYSVLIDVLEAYENDTCHVSEGFVTIYDDIGGNPAEPTVIELENGRAIYTFIAGVPNILGGGEHPYQKLMQIEANVDGQVSTADQWALITGHRPRTQTFFSATTPELPLMILRDPPGDQSYSFLTKNSTHTINYSQGLDTSKLGPNNILPNYLDFNIGAIFSIGWGTGSEVTTDLGGYIKLVNNRFHGDGNESSSGNSISLIMQEELRTSDDEAITGAEGDIYIGASLNQTFFLADIINYDQNTCEVVKDTSLAFQNDGFKSTYIYTEDHIRNTLIPQLEELRSVSENSFDYGQTISVWQQVLFQNDSLKSAAVNKWNGLDPLTPNPEFLLEKNISFSGGTSTTQFANHQSATFSTVTYKRIFESDFLVGAGFVPLGTSLELGWQWKWQSVNSETNDTSNSTEQTVGYTLADNDDGDFFSVDVLSDPFYGTPIFNLVAGTSSCPWEPGTQPRDGAQLGINSFTLKDVPPNEPAVFTLALGNTSESGESRPYDLRMVQLSNPDGAIIKIGGVAMGDALSYYIPAGDSSYKATLTIERGPLSYDYENLQLIMVPPCEFDAYNDNTPLADTVTFSVHFASPLSNAALAYPSDEWEINPDEPDSMQVVINEYNAQNEYLNAIRLEYRRPNGSWNKAFEVNKSELTSQNLRCYWNYSHLDDGEYELRVVSDGGINGVRYSPVAIGSISRKELIMHGQPEPADAVLNLDDQIAIKFSSGINFEKLNVESDISLIDASDSSAIDFSVVLAGNKLILNPDVPFSELSERTLIAIVNNLEDAEGNRLRHPVQWSFEVSQITAYWKSLTSDIRVYEGHESITTGILYNAGSEKIAYQIKHVPSWLQIDSEDLNGEIETGSERHIPLRYKGQSASGMHLDSISVELAGMKENKNVTLNVLPNPPVWSVQQSTGGNYVTHVYSQVLINNKLSKDEFDIVGVFIGDSFCGMGNIKIDEGTGKYTAAFPIYYSSASANSLEFRLWDADEGKEYRYYSDEFLFQSGSTIGSRNEPILIEPNEAYQSISLKSGWNWISFNVATSDLSIDRVLKDYPAKTGDLIKNQYAFSEFSKEYGWIGTLDFLSLESAVRIKSVNSGELVASGLRASNWATPALLSKGWNWISYLPEEKLSIKDALYFMEAIPGDKIQSQTQSAVFNNNGEWLGTLNDLEPGKGYLLYTESPKQLIYPDLKKQNNFELVFPEKTDWFVNVKEYEASMTLIGEFELLEETYGDSSTLVGAFINGECRGLVKPKYIPQLDKYITFMMVYGDPAEVGDTVRIKLYDSNKELIRDSESKFAFTLDNHFGSLQNPELLKALQTDSERIPTSYYLEQNYPNPFNPSTTINYGIPKNGNVTISIYNILGERVAVLVDQVQKAGRYSLVFEANKFGMASSVYFYQIKSEDFVTSKKMLLLK